MRIKKHSIIRHGRKAVTLVELLIAMALMALIFAAIVPQFHAIRTSWANNEVISTLIQNGMVLDEHINRNLSAANKILSVSSPNTPTSTGGFITFEDNLGNTKQYTVSGGYVVFGAVGSEEPLAGPVSKFQIKCYAIDPAYTLTTDVDTIRCVSVITDFNTVSGSTKTFTTSAYLQASANGIVGCWKLDETSGTIAKDSSGNGNNGTVYGTPTWGPGQINGALLFDGSDDYVDLGTDSSLNFGDSKPFTITAWIKTTADEGLIVSLRNSDDDGSDIDFAVGNEGGDYDAGKAMILVRQDGGGQWASVVSEPLVNDGQWHHVAAVRGSGSTVELFVDGNSMGTSSGEESGGAITTNVRAIGCEVYWGEGSSCFYGTIDDVRIYNRALTAAEIAQLANVLKYKAFNEAKVSLSE